MVLALAVTVVGCSADAAGEGPLTQRTDDITTVGLNLDAARVQDVNANVILANPTDHPIRLLSVKSVANPDSPVPVQVRTFRLAGPDRTTSLSGGIVTAEDLGAPLIPAPRAVVPAGAGEDDYLLMVRYAVPRGTRWASDRGLAVTYSTDGHTYTSTWQRRVSLCSDKAMGESFCDEVE